MAASLRSVVLMLLAASIFVLLCSKPPWLLAAFHPSLVLAPEVIQDSRVPKKLIGHFFDLPLQVQTVHHRHRYLQWDFNVLKDLGQGGLSAVRVMTSPSIPAAHSPQIMSSENIPYEALSYVWGEARAAKPLLCEFGRLSITHNLDRALRHLRFENLKRRLWVDAVCIDQTDLGERALQVQYMRLIYKHAARVIVWLGEKQSWTTTAFRFAQELIGLREDFTDNLDVVAVEDYEPDLPSSAPAPASEVGASKRVQAIQLLGDMFKGNETGAEAMTSLFNCAYFTRVWCLQEVAASTYSIAKSEDLEIDMIALLSLLPIVLGCNPTTSFTATLQL